MSESIDFERFFKEHYHRFYFFTLHLVNDEEVSKDIVSDAFEYVWNNHRSLQVANWKTYMYSYLKNKCVDHFRHEEVRNRYAEFCRQVATVDSPDAIEDQDERLDAIRKALTMLTPQTRLVLQECFINRKKYKEVAEELNISVSAVRKHIVKALRKIRERLLII
ncbi:MAG: RNA polymerase sigma-70 factor [Dysgonamonadaceae bacterium]|jgi:RNA polymerase sigma-70 factor (ECF subfamily)|nr:RNA polymerase sigma-70 factor [Dysgonamonadaceae bacterium]